MSIKFILVEDTVYMRAIIKKSLLSYKDEEIDIIAEAENGDKALELIKDLKPDFITLDLNMPIMNGFELARILSVFENPPKIIVITGETNQVKLKQFEALDIPILKKPVNVEQLHSLIRKQSKTQSKTVLSDNSKEEDLNNNQTTENNLLLTSLRQNKKTEDAKSSGFFDAILSNLDDIEDIKQSSSDKKESKYLNIDDELSDNPMPSSNDLDYEIPLSKKEEVLDDESILVLSGSLDINESSLESEAYEIAEKMNYLHLLPEKSSDDFITPIDGADTINEDSNTTSEISFEDMLHQEIEQSSPLDFIGVPIKVENILPKEPTSSAIPLNNDIPSEPDNSDSIKLIYEVDESNNYLQEDINDTKKTDNKSFDFDSFYQGILHSKETDSSNEDNLLNQPDVNATNSKGGFSIDFNNTNEDDVVLEESSNELDLLAKLRQEKVQSSESYKKQIEKECDSYNNDSQSLNNNDIEQSIPITSLQVDITPNQAKGMQKSYELDFQANDLFIPKEEDKTVQKNGFFKSLFKKQ